MITPTNAPTFKVWPVRVNADCEGKTSKIAGHFTSREEAVTFCASDECRRLDEYGQEGWLCDPIDVRGLAPAAAPVGWVKCSERLQRVMSAARAVADWHEKVDSSNGVRYARLILELQRAIAAFDAQSEEDAGGGEG